MILEPVRLFATRLTELVALRLNVLRGAIVLEGTFLVLIAFLLVENLALAILPNLLSFAFCFADLAIMQTTPDIVPHYFE